MKISVKVRIISDLEDFILYKLRNIKTLSIIVIKNNIINKIVMLTKA